ncbi:MAG: oligosaccharide flippase family protein, partial [Nocardioidaceae bacterium]|nr:oligosaccharide flippase family protein [Nocardioidaceae bacterium]
MNRLARRLRESAVSRQVLANCGARLVAMAGLAGATILVARTGGPADVGIYALLRMLPGLVGVLAVAGLPGAMSYFLAPSRRDAPGLWPSVLLITAAGAVLGAAVWLALAPLLSATFSLGSVAVTAAAAATVATQLFLTVGKTALQGLGDRRGGDVVIAAEEVAFLPCYALTLLLGQHGSAALVTGQVLADLVVGVDAWRRVSRDVGRPVLAMFRGLPTRGRVVEMVSYGIRGQVGGMMTLLNLRLDFAVLGAVAGPSLLGAYAVASKYAELLRLPGTALTWVCYPTLTALPPAQAAGQARRIARPAAVAGIVAAVP